VNDLKNKNKMKKLIFLLMVLGAVVSTKAQEVKQEGKEMKKEMKHEEKKEMKSEKKDVNVKDVPSAVVTKFQSLYPAVKDAEWEKKDNNYEAEFKMNDLETSVIINSSGDLVKTKSEIKVTDLPQNAQTYLKNHTGDRIKKATKIVASDGTISYKAKGEDKFIFFDGTGNYVSEKKD
jgi:hypothetical protein